MTAAIVPRHIFSYSQPRCGVWAGPFVALYCPGLWLDMSVPYSAGGHLDFCGATRETFQRMRIWLPPQWLHGIKKMSLQTCLFLIIIIYMETSRKRKKKNSLRLTHVVYQFGSDSRCCRLSVRNGAWNHSSFFAFGWTNQKTEHKHSWFWCFDLSLSYFMKVNLGTH